MLTRIKTDNILDQEVKKQDLADAAVGFAQIDFLSGGSPGDVLTTDGAGSLLFTAVGGVPIALDALTDVDVTTNLPLVGDSLAYDGAFWVPQSFAGNVFALNNLTDVTVSFAAQNDFLRHNGTEWVNTPISVSMILGIGLVAITNIFDDITDIDVAGVTTGQRLQFAGDRWVAVDPTDLVGSGSDTFVVLNIAARDALSPADGDSAFVRNGATAGEWEMYIWDAGAGPAAWILTSTLDSAATDARTIAGDINVLTISPVLLGNVSPNSRVTLVTINVSVAFDGSPVLTVGTDANNNELATDEELDLGAIGTYTIVTDVEYTASPDTDIKAYFAVGGATVGNARVLVTYV